MTKLTVYWGFCLWSGYQVVCSGTGSRDCKEQMDWSTEQNAVADINPAKISGVMGSICFVQPSTWCHKPSNFLLCKQKMQWKITWTARSPSNNTHPKYPICLPWLGPQLKWIDHYADPIFSTRLSRYPIGARDGSKLWPSWPSGRKYDTNRYTNIYHIWKHQFQHVSTYRQPTETVFFPALFAWKTFLMLWNPSVVRAKAQVFMGIQRFSRWTPLVIHGCCTKKIKEPPNQKKKNISKRNWLKKL